MTATKTITWTTKNGKQVEVKITRTCEVQDKIAHADGYNVNLGKETNDSLYIEVCADGKFVTRSYHAPEILDPKFYGNYNQLKAAGAHARLGDTYINIEQYSNIMALISQLDSEVTGGEEFAAVKAQEIAKEAKIAEVLEQEAAEHERMVKNPGYCTKCHSYCWGDCTAN